MCGVGAAAHPDELEERLNRRQLLEWIAFARIRPFGEHRADIRSALQTFWLRNAWLENLEHTPEDYMPDFGDGPGLTEATMILNEIRECM